MSYIRRFRQLQSRLAEIETHFLPTTRLSGNYTKRELDNTRAYCILCHAEIEAFLEDVAILKADSAVNSWVNSGKKRLNAVVFNLATYCSQAPATRSNTPNQLVLSSHNNFRTVVRNNHGIRQDNLTNLFSKIGFDVDQTLSSTLDSFGQVRGAVAHTAIRTQQPLDPQTEKNRITLITTGLQSFTTDFANFS